MFAVLRVPPMSGRNSDVMPGHDSGACRSTAKKDVVLRAERGQGEYFFNSGAIRKTIRRVEDRLSPALPHQTVHALLTHTAFRCSSRQGMRIRATNVYQRD